MDRSPSWLAQITFNIVNRLSYWSRHSGPMGQFAARALNRVARAALRFIGKGHTVNATIYKHPMTMPAEHTIAHTLQIYPQYNRPLGLAALAVSMVKGKKSIAVVDVGANIGETVAIVDQACPGLASYLCIDADAELAKLCQHNHANNERVLTEVSFIGENEGQLVALVDDGKASPSTIAVDRLRDGAHPSRLVRLDTIAAPFATAHNGIDLIKIDTEGYDFSILRSGSSLLVRYKPALFFEWYPKLLHGLGENPSEGFRFLQEMGYKYFIFYTSIGDYYCKLKTPDSFVLETLAHVTLRDNMYFDVFACDSEVICDQAIRLSVNSERAYTH